MDKPVKHCSRTHPQCRQELNVNDPHDRCLRHNDSCFANYTYDPTDCSHCSTLIEGTKAKNHIASSIFQERITGMRRSISLAYKSKKLPDEAKARFEASGGKDVFAARARHLDPRPRSISPAQGDHTRSTTSATRASSPRHDILAAAVAATGELSMLASQPNTSPVPEVSFTGFPEDHPDRDTSPPAPTPNASPRQRPRQRRKRLFGTSSSSSLSEEDKQRRRRQSRSPSYEGHRRSKKARRSPALRDIIRAEMLHFKEAIRTELREDVDSAIARSLHSRDSHHNPLPSTSGEGARDPLDTPTPQPPPPTTNRGDGSEGSHYEYDPNYPGYSFRSPERRSSSPEADTQVPDEFYDFFVWPEECIEYEDAIAFPRHSVLFRQRRIRRTRVPGSENVSPPHVEYQDEQPGPSLQQDGLQKGSGGVKAHEIQQPLQRGEY